MSTKNSDSDKIRLDKWLWAARFFKTRSLATAAVNGGHVHLNGSRAKPSRSINLDDTVRIKKGEIEFIVHVRGLSEHRGPASVAQTLYEETDESRNQRENQAQERRILAITTPRPAKRPNKHDRRHIIRFRRSDD